MKLCMKLFVMFAVVLSLFGCAQYVPPKDPVSVTLHSDQMFNDAERQCIETAGAQWRSQTNGLATFDFVWDYNSTDPKSVKLHTKDDKLIKWTSSNIVLAREELEGFVECVDSGEDPEECSKIGILGQVSPDGGIKTRTDAQPVEMKLVTDRFDMPMCQRVAIHELGHVLGLPHVSTSTENIMFPIDKPSRTACLKPDDLLMYCFTNDCGNVKLNPCSAANTGD